MELKTTKVYVPTDVKLELPKETGKVGIIINGNFDFAYWMKTLTIFDHHRSGLNHKQKDITHWLKEKEGYFLTKEELEEFKKQIAGDAWDAGIDWVQDTSDFPMGNCKKEFLDKQDYINSILK